MELRRPGSLPAVEVRLDVVQEKLLAQPMHMPGDVRQVEARPLKGAAIQLEMQISRVLSMHGDGAIDMGNRRLLELVGLDLLSNVSPDGARDDHRLDGAEAIRQED